MSATNIKNCFWSTYRFCVILRYWEVYRLTISTKLCVYSFSLWLPNAVVLTNECNYWNCNVIYLCTQRSVLEFKYIPEGQAQPSTQSLLHVSCTDSAWQVLPQVDAHILYSFVSSHERAVQTKQSSWITVQETHAPPKSFFSFSITLNSTKIAILALCCVNYTDVNPQ